MAHFLLLYDLAPDYLDRRAALRERHLAFAWEAAERGELLLGGALDEPVDRAMLLVSGDGPEIAEAFARADPYVTERLVTDWRVRRWTTVVGGKAATPMR